MLGMSKEVEVESGYRIVATEVEYRRKNFVKIFIPSITISFKSGFLFRNFFLLLFKFSLGESEL